MDKLSVSNDLLHIDFVQWFKITSGHTTVNIGTELVPETFLEALPTNCDTHEKEQLRIYCLDCESVICVTCYITNHNTHKCSDVKQIAETFRKQMARDAENTADGIQKCREMLEGLEKEKNDFEEQTKTKEKQISTMAEQLKQMIDDHKEKLMHELSSIKQKRINEIESVHEEIEIQLITLKNYKKYLDDLRQKGAACDIASCANGLHDRADDLLKFDAIERSLFDLGHSDVTLTSSNYDINHVNKTLGQLRQNTVKGGELIYF